MKGKKSATVCLSISFVLPTFHDSLSYSLISSICSHFECLSSPGQLDSVDFFQTVDRVGGREKLRAHREGLGETRVK